MAEYTKLQKKDVLSITNKYDLKIIGYDPIEQGQGNTTYLLHTAQRKYILTIFEIAHNRAINLCKLLKLLEDHNYPTTRVEKTTNGEELTSVKGKLAMVKPYIPGQVVWELDEDMLNQVGKAMARLHQIPSPDYLPDKLEFGLEFIGWVKEQDINLEYKKWLAHKYEFLQKSIPSGLPRGLIHADVYYDNVLFDGKKFKALIDFEEACNYYKIFGLGMAIVGTCTGKEKILLPKVRSLVDGYQKIIKLKRIERRSLQLFAVYAASALSAWRYWKYNIDTPTVKQSKKYKEFVNVANAADAISNEEFMASVFS